MKINWVDGKGDEEMPLNANEKTNHENANEKEEDISVETNL